MKPHGDLKLSYSERFLLNYRDLISFNSPVFVLNIVLYPHPFFFGLQKAKHIMKTKLYYNKVKCNL